VDLRANPSGAFCEGEGRVTAAEPSARVQVRVRAT